MLSSGAEKRLLLAVINQGGTTNTRIRPYAGYTGIFISTKEGGKHEQEHLSHTSVQGSGHHFCRTARDAVRLVAMIRDHGGVLFLDLRDNTDTIQVVSNDDSMFRGIAKESVVKVTGTIRRRSEETFNVKLHTGEIELLVDELEVLGRSKNELPFEILTSKNTKEDVRLK